MKLKKNFQTFPFNGYSFNEEYQMFECFMLSMVAQRDYRGVFEGELLLIPTPEKTLCFDAEDERDILYAKDRTDDMIYFIPEFWSERVHSYDREADQFSSRIVIVPNEKKYVASVERRFLEQQVESDAML